MNYIDGLILLFILLAAFKGYRQGLIRSLTGLAGTLASIFLAFQWSPAFAVLLEDKYALKSKLSSWLIDFIPFPQAAASLNPNEIPAEQLGEVLAQTGLPLILREGLLSQWENGSLVNFSSFHQAAAEGLGAMLLKLAAFLLIMAVLVILFRLLGNLLTAGIGHTFLGTINRLAGLLLGVLTITVFLGLAANIALPLLGLSQEGMPEAVASSLLVPQLSYIYGFFSTFIFSSLSPDGMI